VSLANPFKSKNYPEMSCFQIVHKLKTGVAASYCIGVKNNHAPGVYSLMLVQQYFQGLDLKLAFIWLDSTRKINKISKDANRVEQDQVSIR
jgi:hypothetical protein